MRGRRPVRHIIGHGNDDTLAVVQIIEQSRVYTQIVSAHRSSPVRQRDAVAVAINGSNARRAGDRQAVAVRVRLTGRQISGKRRVILSFCIRNRRNHRRIIGAIDGHRNGISFGRTIIVCGGNDIFNSNAVADSQKIKIKTRSI